jgi:Deoxycytidylate deaminase
MSDRVPWPTYFMRIAHLVAERSTCIRRRVGAVAVRDKRMIATGYNGTPTNVPHCGEVGCIRERLGIPSGQRHELCRGLHAEQNVIIQCALHGLSLGRGGNILHHRAVPHLHQDAHQLPGARHILRRAVPGRTGGRHAQGSGG